MAIELPIEIHSKRVQWGGVIGDADIVWLREDLSAATFKMEVRTEADGSGTVLLTLNNASAGAEGFSASYDAGYLHPVTGLTVGATTIRPQINETTFEGLATASPADEPVTAYYDIHATYGGAKRLLTYGTFTYYPGVTQ